MQPFQDLLLLWVSEWDELTCTVCWGRLELINPVPRANCPRDPFAPRHPGSRFEMPTHSLFRSSLSTKSSISVEDYCSQAHTIHEGNKKSFLLWGIVSEPEFRWSSKNMIYRSWLAIRHHYLFIFLLSAAFFVVMVVRASTLSWHWDQTIMPFDTRDITWGMSIEKKGHLLR